MSGSVSYSRTSGEPVFGKGMVQITPHFSGLSATPVPAVKSTILDRSITCIYYSKVAGQNFSCEKLP